MRFQNIIVKHHGRKVSGQLYFPKTNNFPVVIMSHGFNGCGNDFKDYAKILVENDIGVCTFDFCGGSLNSKSDLSTTDMTVFTEKEDLLAVIDFVEKQQNVKSVFLFGASMGGLVSALCAEERTDRIQGMILLYPALCVADDWNNRFLSVDDIPEIHQVWEVPLGKCFFETLRGFDVFEHIGKFKKDVLIIHGDKDSIVPLEYSTQANKIYTNPKLQVFNGEGHGFSADGDRCVAEIIIEFVKSESRMF
jgi:hypothetical protein